MIAAEMGLHQPGFLRESFHELKKDEMEVRIRVRD